MLVTRRNVHKGRFKLTLMEAILMMTVGPLKDQCTALILGLLVESPSVKVVTELYSELVINPLPPGSVHAPMALFFWARL